MNRRALLLAALLLAAVAASGVHHHQDTSPYVPPKKRPPAPSDFFDKPEEYLNWQAQNILDMVEEISSRFPPQLAEPIERHMAMLMLDAVFHDEIIEQIQGP